MPLKFTRRASSKPAGDWREEQTLVQANARIAELAQRIRETQGRVANRASDTVAAEQHLRRAEMEALAGKIPDSVLAAKQQAHLDARVAEAKDRIAVEDLQAEKAELEKKLPDITRKAKQAAHADLQTRAVTLLKELQGHLQAAVQAEADLQLLRNDAGNQFEPNIADPRSEVYEPEFTPFADIPLLTQVVFHRDVGIREATTIESRNASVLADIAEALARLDKAA